MKLPLGCGRVSIKANFAIRLLPFTPSMPIYLFVPLFLSVYLLFVTLFLFSSIIRPLFVILYAFLITLAVITASVHSDCSTPFYFFYLY